MVFVIFSCGYLIYYFIGNVNESNFEIFNCINEDFCLDVFKVFIKDFGYFDYLVGRGIDGLYYDFMKYWNFVNDDYREVNYRINIENGFLYMIMKGGLIYLVIFLLIFLCVLYLGFFRFKNFLVKGFVFYLMIYLFDMVVYG